MLASEARTWTVKTVGYTLLLIYHVAQTYRVAVWHHDVAKSFTVLALLLIRSIVSEEDLHRLVLKCVLSCAATRNNALPLVGYPRAVSVGVACLRTLSSLPVLSDQFGSQRFRPSCVALDGGWTHFVVCLLSYL